MSNNLKARVIAIYLPQFHPIPENDEWWGKGFTEWTNVGKAKKFFRGHYQPRVPADLGYYDLRLAEAREAQAELAHKYGVEGFCYWHYWFGNGKRLLERPINEVIESGKPDFPFCLSWANETWKGFAHGLKNRNVLMEQLYPGDEDYITHFNAVLPSLKDRRYIKIDGKPLFMVYKPNQLPDASHFIKLWQKLSVENGLEGIYFVAHHQSCKEQGGKTEEQSYNEFLNMGFDAVNFVRVTNILDRRSLALRAIQKLNRIFFNRPLVYTYKRSAKFFTKPIDKKENAIPSIIPGWDHTPRSGREGFVMTNTTPKLFGQHIAKVMRSIESKPFERRLVFIKSWNEWAEGNYMEPDLKWGHAFLEELKKQITSEK